MQYRRTPTACGYSPSELLNNRQLRTKIDTLLPSSTQIPCKPKKMQPEENIRRVTHQFKFGDPCYALYFGPRRNHDPRWVPAVVMKRKGSRTVHVRVTPRGPIWRRHMINYALAMYPPKMILAKSRRLLMNLHQPSKENCPALLHQKFLLFGSMENIIRDDPEGSEERRNATDGFEYYLLLFNLRSTIPRS